MQFFQQQKADEIQSVIEPTLPLCGLFHHNFVGLLAKVGPLGIVWDLVTSTSTTTTTTTTTTLQKKMHNASGAFTADCGRLRRARRWLDKVSWTQHTWRFDLMVFVTVSCYRCTCAWKWARGVTCVKQPWVTHKSAEILLQTCPKESFSSK